MKPFKRLAIALVVPLLMTVVARRAQIAATPAELQRGTATGVTGRAAQAQPSQEPPARGVRGGRGMTDNFHIPSNLLYRLYLGL